MPATHARVRLAALRRRPRSRMGGLLIAVEEVLKLMSDGFGAVDDIVKAGTRVDRPRRPKMRLRLL